MKTPPNRTCLGCRQTRPKVALVRLVRLPSGTVVADFATRAAGRGAYVCPNAECVERALSRGRLGHAFKMPSEAAENLAAVLLAALRRADERRVSEAGREAVLCEAAVGTIGRDDVMTVGA